MQIVSKKLMDISSEHMTEADAKALPASSVVVYETDEYGWLVWVPKAKEGGADYANDMSEAFQNVLKEACVAECDYVWFDRDGPRYNDLESFDW